MSCSVLSTLRALGPFQYVPNDGNLGDLLIDVATRQLFHRWGLPVQSGPCRCVVYGGGGRFVPFYGSLDSLQAMLTAAHLSHCVILPHSFYQADEFLRSLDERHTVFCRERRSLRYARSLNRRARFLPAHDMALHLHPVSLQRYTSGSWPSCVPAEFTARLRAGIDASCCTLCASGHPLRCAFFPRSEQESILPSGALHGADLSLLWLGRGDGSVRQAGLIRALLEALSTLDIVFSDRLHLCIAALFAGCRVGWLDNTYGKLSGVYHQSFSGHPRAFPVDAETFVRLWPELARGACSLSDAEAVLWASSPLKTRGAVQHRCFFLPSGAYRPGQV